MNLPEFWEDKTRAQSKMAEVAALKNKVLPVREMNSRIGDLPLLIEMALEENDDSAAQEALKEVEAIQAALDKIELQTLLSGPHDREGAYLTVHAGAGGTEACDWADMLVRMYQRWGSQQGFKVEMIDVQEGEEVGVRGATLRFEGENAYGYLNCERGVHRLVRISPFDSRRGGTPRLPVSTPPPISRKSPNWRSTKRISRSRRCVPAARAVRTSTRSRPASSCATFPPA